MFSMIHINVLYSILVWIYFYSSSSLYLPLFILIEEVIRWSIILYLILHRYLILEQSKIHASHFQETIKGYVKKRYGRFIIETDDNELDLNLLLQKYKNRFVTLRIFSRLNR